MRIPLQIIVFAALFMGGCASTRMPAEKAKETPGERMRRFEADFRPSDYDRTPEREPGAVEGRSEAPVDSTPAPVTAPAPEQEPGFRIQIFSTTSIDEANARKAVAEEQFPNEWFYLEYDQPTYKIRAGNFRTRFAAERFLDQLTEKGFPGAWVVPEKVFKNPPPPPPRPAPEGK
jgi:hypothetical protein